MTHRKTDDGGIWLPLGLGFLAFCVSLIAYYVFTFCATYMRGP